MTVDELINELKKFPQDMEVLTYPAEPIHGICKDTIPGKIGQPNKKVVMID